MSRLFFADMNAFFASCEQQERPELRGKPMIVVPYANMETTCAIAASYEAKALGIKTGTRVKAARKVCPQLEVVEARPQVYLDYHTALLDVLNAHFVSIQVLSVDEMACRISCLHTTTEAETRLARQVKADIYHRLGEGMHCSVGIGPNVFLAKVAGDRQKPCGLTVWSNEDLPDALFDLQLLDLPGIANRMLLRLEAHGIRTVRQLYEADSLALKRAWGRGRSALVLDAPGQPGGRLRAIYRAAV